MAEEDCSNKVLETMRKAGRTGRSENRSSWRLPLRAVHELLRARKWLHENKTFENAEDLPTHIKSLSKDPERAEKAVRKVVEKIIDSKAPRSKRLERWVKDLQESLLQVLEDFKEDSQNELEKHLEMIASLCKPRMYDVMTSAESFL